jgi:exopolysaccharide production protein ExoZ
MPPSRNDLLTVQALRAIAALMVVAYHCLDTWGRHTVGRTADALWGNGSAGVDIFFVISGLVMTITAGRVSGRPHAAWVFLRQRLTRIVPLYWVVTTAKIVAVLALPALVSQTRLTALYVAGSYALVPVRDSTGDLRPILPVGWTLSYEMLFYLLVAIAVALRLPILRVALPALLLFASVALMDSSGFPNTIALEFLYGVGIGMLSRDQTGPAGMLRTGVAAIVLVGGFAVILLAPSVSGAWRPITWGVPAACIVAGAVALEQRIRPVLAGWLLAAGDASYAIYLTHGFVVPLVFALVTKIQVPAAPSLAITMIGGLLLSLWVGNVTHAHVERPMLNWLRRRPVFTGS